MPGWAVWCLLSVFRYHVITDPGARPINDISIEFEIRSNFAVLWSIIYSTDHNEILHTSRQCYCRDVCKMSLWSAKYVMNKSIAKCHWISNLIEIQLVGQAPVLNISLRNPIAHWATLPMRSCYDMTPKITMNMKKCAKFLEFLGLEILLPHAISCSTSNQATKLLKLCEGEYRFCTHETLHAMHKPAMGCLT